jgi:hypothetical protein
MSPRMQALWDYLDSTPVALNPFSTDSAVRSQLPRLRAALIGSPSPTVAEDIRSLIRRVPEARVTTATATPAATVTPAVTPHLSDQGIIRGVSEHAIGAEYGWYGCGELTLDEIVSVLPEEMKSWAPTAKSFKAQLGSAITLLTARGYVARVARRARGENWISRWIVGSANAAQGQVGQNYGSILLTATLTEQGLSLEADSDHGESLATIVSDEYSRLTGAHVFKAGEVTSWLKGTLCRHLGGSRCAGRVFVRAAEMERADALTAAVRNAGFGTEWTIPNAPLTTCDYLRNGIAAGFVKEIADLIASIETQRRTIKAKDKSKDIGGRAGTTAINALQGVLDRAQSFGDVLGAEHFAPVLKEARALLSELDNIVDDTIVDDTSIRASLLELDDAPRAPAGPSEAQERLERLAD